MGAIYRTNNPTEFDDVDQIVVDETAPPGRIQGASSRIALMCGQFERGPESVVEITSLKQMRETFGNDNSFAGNISLKNKKFGRLKLRRVVAAAAVKASKTFQASATDIITFTAKYKGAYGNSISVTIADATLDVHEITQIDAVADSSDSLDGTYFILQDKDGSVAFWIDTDDSGTTIPSGASAADRAVEITTIVTDDDADTVAGKLVTAIGADSQFSAALKTGETDVLLVTDAESGPRDAASAGDSGFTVAESVAGVEAGKKYTIADGNSTSNIPAEVYDNVQIGSITASTFANSLLVDVAVVATSSEPDNVSATVLTSGADGSIADTDYETAIESIEGAKCNVVFLDQYNATRRGYLKLHAAATQDRMCIGAGLESDAVSVAQSDAAAFRDTDGRLIYSYPWVQTTIDGGSQYTSPASWMASIISQTSPHIDPAWSDNAKYLVGISALKFDLQRKDYINLKNSGIAAFEFDEDIGFKVKSGVTTQIANSSKTQILRRRMADWLTESVGKFFVIYQNGPNTSARRLEMGSGILSFVGEQEKLGILPKDSEVEDGRAKLVDVESLNTADSLGAGYTYIVYKQRIYSSMRFIVLMAEIGETVRVTDSD